MDIRLVEHISSVWSYHLADFDVETQGLRTALCGRKEMMPTGSGAPNLHIWGVVSGGIRIRERYCSKCEEIARQQGVRIGREAPRPKPGQQT